MTAQSSGVLALPGVMVPKFWMDTEVALRDSMPGFKPRTQQAATGSVLL